ncbi:MAG: hypothetical protein DRG78_01495 [Epsilonproteobacteria bacterium]|nr:MAG: hypothetical protein DRG78_01495 [Campylobacterota bacterium]
MLDVYNAGKGDAFLFSHQCYGINCCPLLIDTGTSGANIHSKVPRNLREVMITHSHADHIGGLVDILNNRRILTLYIPYYLPEILAIKKFLYSRLSTNTDILNRVNRDIVLLKEGDRLCRHSTILNPSVSPIAYNTSNELIDIDIEKTLESLNTFGLKLDTKAIMKYVSPLANKQLHTRIKIHNNERSSSKDKKEYFTRAKKFVHNFFFTLEDALSDNSDLSIDSSKLEIAKFVNSHFKLTANDASIVMRYKDDDESYLFTGDAGIKVFNRLILKCPSKLQANVLKVPHHGSKENLTEEILEAIKPKIAILSHNGSEYHPSDEVLDMLELLGIADYHTNNVSTDTYTIVKKTGDVSHKGKEDIYFDN